MIAGAGHDRPHPAPLVPPAPGSPGREPIADVGAGPCDLDQVAAQLFRTRYADLVGLARLLVDDTDTAEEVVQEAFVRLYASWPRLRDRHRAEAYLRSSVWNLARDRLRRRRTVRWHESTARAEGDRLGTRPVTGPADSLLGDERRRTVAAALDRLPRRQRECLVLRYWQDLSERDIAATLGISAGSVKRHVHRAMTKLADQLEAP